MRDALRTRSTGRSLLAILAGLLVIVLLSVATDEALRAVGVFSPLGQPMSGWLFLIAAAHRALYSALGCYLAARLAPRHPMRHALLLGGAGVLLGLVGAAATWSEGPDFGPKWYPVSLILIAMPCAWYGGARYLSRSGA